MIPHNSGLIVTSYSTSNDKVTPRLDQRITIRWLRWLPFANLAARKKLPYITIERSLIDAKLLHRDRIVQLLRLDIPWTTICRGNLDDPTMGRDKWTFEVGEAIKRRNDRFGRVKGIVTSPTNLYKKQYAHLRKKVAGNE